MIKGMIAAGGVAIIFAVVTLQSGHLPLVPDNPVLATSETALITLLSPGLLVAAVKGSLLVGAAVNAAIYFVLMLLLVLTGSVLR